jgi:hypothetical protein
VSRRHTVPPPRPGILSAVSDSPESIPTATVTPVPDQQPLVTAAFRQSAGIGIERNHPGLLPRPVRRNADIVVEVRYPYDEATEALEEFETAVADVREQIIATLPEPTEI